MTKVKFDLEKKTAEIDGVAYNLTPCAATVTHPFTSAPMPTNQDKPVMEKDWEVQTYYIKDKPGIIYHKSLGGFTLVNSMSTVKEKDLIHSGYDIHTVRRTSDNTEWSKEKRALGQHELCSEVKEGIIKEFYIPKVGGMIVYLEGENIPYKLSELSKPVKKAALLTEDGVEVLDTEETVYYISDEWEPIPVTAKCISNQGQCFKHRSNAEAYVKKNKKKYSEQQLMDAMNITSEDLDKFEISDPLEIIKIKLGIKGN